jgi:SAM-dependent methyltransferase
VDTHAMKVRESGMPDEKVWDSFFDAQAILSRLRLDSGCRDAIEFGCGHGTFTIPAARIISGTLHALDIEPEMVAATIARSRAAGLNNVRVCLRDFVMDGTGLPDSSVDCAMLFNILHGQRPEALLGEAFRVVRPGGLVGIIHWNYDPSTPRGPSMDIRPRPGQCLQWAQESGFILIEPGIIDLPPYHYGIALRRPPRD